MVEVTLSQEADRDLDAIFEYSVVHWCVEQAVRYLSQFDAQFKLLAELPYFGTRRPDIAEGLRSLTCGSHVIYFSCSDGHVAIARVLHGRMAPKDHL